MVYEERTVYLAQWDKHATGYVAQAVIFFSMVERLEKNILKEIPQILIDKDYAVYLDVY